MILTGNKGLIVDFAVEDARALHKRKIKFESFAKKQEERKKEEKEFVDPKQKNKDNFFMTIRFRVL